MSQAPLRILIVDDETERSKGWESDIQRCGLAGCSATVQALDRDASRAIIEQADLRRRHSRAGKDPFDGTLACGFDDADVLIVDYDLEELVAAGTTSTGLWVAMLARAFTRVKLVVLVNQFVSNKFDLTLTAAMRSRADIDVGEAQLLNPALWDRSKVDGYAPWSWMDGVQLAGGRIEATVQWVLDRLNQPVLNALGFSSDVDEHTGIAQELWQELVADTDRTFKSMVAEAKFLTPKDAEAIGTSDLACARVAAAMVVHWLDRCVVPSGDVLIDLPHLASANPWLLKDRSEAAGWDASVVEGFAALESRVNQHEYLPGFRLARPVVWRKKASADPLLAEPAGFTYDDFPDLVFCEDVSRFHPFDKARAFTCRLPTGDTQRFVANPKDVAPTKGGFSLSDVAYEPSVLFAL